MIDIQDTWLDVYKLRVEEYNKYCERLSDTEQLVLGDIYKWWYAKTSQTEENVVCHSRHPIYDLQFLIQAYWKERLE